MKLKLITIVALALLLCATVPMAATAAKPTTSPKPIVAPVYYSMFVFPEGEGTLGPRVGTATIATIQDTTKYTYTLTGLTPGEWYWVGYGIVIETGGSFAMGMQFVQADAHGHATAKGTLNSFVAGELKDTLADGGVLLAWQQAST